MPNSSSGATPWEELGRIYRHICSLRAQGREAEAQAVHDGDFAAALAAARGHSGPGAETEERLRILLAAEEGRVADAAALADLLVPLLLERLRLPLPEDAAPLPRLQPPRRLAPSSVPSVADFIDDMLAQQRASRLQNS